MSPLPLAAFAVFVGLIVLTVYVGVMNDRHRKTEHRLKQLEQQTEEHHWRLRALEPPDAQD